MTVADVWLPLGTAVVGALAALAGSALGPLVGSRTAHQEWLRDKRADLLESCYALLILARSDLVERDVSATWGSNKTPSLDGASHLSEQLMAAGARAQLYVSPGLGNQLQELAVEYLECAGLMHLNAAPQMWEAQVQAWKDKNSRTRDLIQREIGVR